MGSRVVIGMDPHKRSATIEVMADDEQVLGGGRFGTDPAGFEAMLTIAKHWSDRVWAVEGCEGIGKHLVLRLLEAGEQVVDVSIRPAVIRERAYDFAGLWVYVTDNAEINDSSPRSTTTATSVEAVALRAG
jgi:transposase